MTAINPASQPQSAFGKFIHNLEENFIAASLGLMTLITFANVVARYVFNSNILWALELTVYLFAWLVLIGASYGVKMHFHIGVDIAINKAPKALRKLLTIIAVGFAIVFAGMLFTGALIYWLPFAGLEELLFDDDALDQAYIVVEDIPMLPFLNFLSELINEGEQYEKLPQFIPYAALPIGMGLLLYRVLEQGWHILHGRVDSLVAGHEVEEPANLRKELAAAVATSDNKITTERNRL